MKHIKRLFLSCLAIAALTSGGYLFSASCSAYNNCGGSCSVIAPVTSCHYGSVAICMGYNTNGQVISHYYVACPLNQCSGGCVNMP